MAKTYINGIIIKEIETQYGNILKVSIKVKDFIEQLQQHESKGWVNLDINRRKEKSDSGQTHYVALDEWKPNKPKSEPPAESYTVDNPEIKDTNDNEDLPF